jgi:hypothetical protein
MAINALFVPLATAALLACGALTACSSSPARSTTSPSTDSGGATAPASVTQQASSSSENGPEDQCAAKNSPNEPDIVFRFKDPGTTWNAQFLGGGFQWNYTLKTCQTAADFMLSTVVDGPRPLRRGG